MRRYAVIFIAIFFIISFVATAAHAIKVNIDPSRIDIQVKAGKTANGFITVDNLETETPVHIKVYSQDLVYLPDGTNDFLPAGTTQWSCAPWVKVRPMEFELEPGKSQTVRYNISVPKDAEGGCYGVIFFETKPIKPSGAQGTLVDVSVRMGTIVSIMIPNTTIYQAVLTNLEMRKSEDKNMLNAVTTIANKGNILIRPQGILKIQEQETGAVIEELDLNQKNGGILPKTAREFMVQFKKPAPGKKYETVVTFDYGGDTLIAGQVLFSVDSN